VVVTFVHGLAPHKNSGLPNWRHDGKFCSLLVAEGRYLADNGLTVVHAASSKVPQELSFTSWLAFRL